MEKINFKAMMVKNHNKIVGFFNQFKRAINNRDKSFNKFKWELEKHLFIEENIIFSHTKLKMGDDLIIPRLIEEHKDMLKMLGSLKGDLANKIKLKKFEELLKKHRNFEDKTLYPLLDKRLNDSEKRDISERINNVKMY